MATSGQELFELARQRSMLVRSPDAAVAEEAISALRHVARVLRHVTAPCVGRPSRSMKIADQLATACAAAAAEWPERPSQLGDLVGAAADILCRADELDRDEQWAIAVEAGETARRCVELALRHPPYAAVSSLRWAHAAAVALEKEAACLPPAAYAYTVLQSPVPAAVEPLGRPVAIMADALARLRLELHHDARCGHVPVAAVLASAAAAEAFTQRCVEAISAPVEHPSRQAPAAWRVTYAALARFEDGSRRCRAEPSSSVRAARDVQHATALLERHYLTHLEPGEQARVARQVPALAVQLRTAIRMWGQRPVVFARARDLVRTDALVRAVLDDAVVPVTADQLLPIGRAVAVAQALSDSLAAQLTGERQPAPTVRTALVRDARWASRLAHRAEEHAALRATHAL